ncbi:MAG: DUF2254 domain-containing protein [Myxococcota bacterium]
MIPRLLAIAEQVRTSLWFVPTVMVIGALFVAWGSLEVDVQVDTTGSVWWLNQGTAEDAGRLFSTLLGSLITMATLVISITMVVLTLAAGQLGPRLIRAFVGDRRAQFVIGFFLATVAYLLVVYRLLDGTLPKEAVPHFAVTLGSGLVFACLGALIFYVHHLSRSIVADTMVDRVGTELDRAIAANLPASDGDGPRQLVRGVGPPARLGFEQSGYLQAIDHGAIASAAKGRDALVELGVRPGHHVLADRDHVFVWPAAALDDAFAAAIRESVAIGPERTAFQDLEFSIRQLVEIALRALSPGINDPFTAIAVIDRIAASLAMAMTRAEVPSSHPDEDGRIRVLADTSTFEGLVDLGFNQIRQAASTHVDVLIDMTDALGALAERPRSEKQRAVLRRHLDAVRETGRLSIRHASDLAALEHRSARAIEAADRA